MRLPNGFGSVYKLSGHRRKPWCARKTVGWKDDPVKMRSYPVYQFIGYYPTRQEALTALVNYNNDPYDLHADTMTLAELYDRWTDEHFQRVSDSNVKGCKAAWKILEPIQNMKIVDLRLDHFQDVANNSGKNLPTLTKWKNMLSMMYDYAVKHEIVKKEKHDMITYIDLSRAKNPNAISRIPFNKSELSALWDNSSAPYVDVILMLIYTGARIGEMLDLKKENVNLEEHWFDVTASKTLSGIRRVPIADKVLPFFEQWYNTGSCQYLISTPDDKHFGYDKYYNYFWQPQLEKLGMFHRPHDTRHTCITMLTEAGIDERIIKRIVGHKGEGVTETVYTHMGIEVLIEAINKI